MAGARVGVCWVVGMVGARVAVCWVVLAADAQDKEARTAVAVGWVVFGVVRSMLGAGWTVGREEPAAMEMEPVAAVTEMEAAEAVATVFCFASGAVSDVGHSLVHRRIASRRRRRIHEQPGGCTSLAPAPLGSP